MNTNNYKKSNRRQYVITNKDLFKDAYTIRLLCSKCWREFETTVLYSKYFGVNNKDILCDKCHFEQEEKNINE